jgi:peptidoglycan hydrolase-like protein with peptidoglycan-binding domain
VDDAYAAIIYKKDQKGLVPLGEIQTALPEVNWGSLNTVTDWKDMTHGAGGPNVQRLQENLTALSYLNGGIDGSYGNGTADAVYRFQTDHGLTPNGETDIFTFFTIAEAVDGKPDPITVTYPTEVKVDTKFASIFKDAENPADLAAYLDPEWIFSYDVYEGTGLIENMESGDLANYADESRPIDTIHLALRKVVRLVRDESGSIQVVPALQITSAGAYRPYVQEILVRNGSKVITLPVFDSTGGIDGTNVTEESYVELTDEAEELLKEDGTTLRVKGSSKQYDLEA